MVLRLALSRPLLLAGGDCASAGDARRARTPRRQGASPSLPLLGFSSLLTLLSAAPRWQRLFLFAAASLLLRLSRPARIAAFSARAVAVLLAAGAAFAASLGRRLGLSRPRLSQLYYVLTI
jgi:hypothetical protein